MITMDVLCSISIGGDTVVAVIGDNPALRNGIEVLDDDGRAYKLKSVGLYDEYADVGFEDGKTTPLLIEGEFASEHVFICDYREEMHEEDIADAIKTVRSRRK